MDLNAEDLEVKLKVIGVGGAGNNAINLMLDENLPNVELLVANSDRQDLVKSLCPNKILLGDSTRGFGAGGDPKVGRECALESIKEIQKSLENTDIVIISAGLGGGTGTGAAPVIAEAAKKMGILTVAVVTTPFELIEGKHKSLIAQEGLKKLSEVVDSYIVISNQKLVENYRNLPVQEAFKVSNYTLKNSIKIIRDIIFETGFINLDFNDLRQVLLDGKETIIRIGNGFGKDRAIKAVDDALMTPLFQSEIKNCQKVAILFQCDKRASLDDIETAKNRIDEYLANNLEAQTFIGLQYIDTQDREEIFRISIIASNLNANVSTNTYAVPKLLQRNVSEHYEQNMQNTYTQINGSHHTRIMSYTVQNYEDENEDVMPNFFDENH